MKEVRKFERAANPSAVSGTFSSLVDEAPHSTKEVHDIPYREEEEEEEVEERLDYRPCHYFDYIAGTSTGGLIAILLGRLRMDVDLALETYKDLCRNIFGKTSSRIVSFWGNTKDTTRSVAMDRKFQSLPRAQPSPDEENSRFKSDAFRCRTVVCSIKSGPRKHS